MTRTRLIICAAVAAALATAGCSSDSDSANGAAPTTVAGGQGGTTVAAGGATETSAATGEPVVAPGSLDCTQVEEDLTNISLAAQIYPQLRDGAAIIDDFVLTDPMVVKAAAERVRPLVGAEAAAFLDDIARGADIILAGRTGDADAAAAELAVLTGGMEGLNEWLFRQLPLGEDIAAAGCNL